MFNSYKTFSLWKDVCNNYVSGKIADARGELGKVKACDAINVAMFRCFEGDISKAEISRIFRVVLNGDLLLKKADFKSCVHSMEDAAKDIKIERKLKVLILEYLAAYKPNHFTLSMP